jgi:hypothetical protein
VIVGWHALYPDYFEPSGLLNNTFEFAMGAIANCRTMTGKTRMEGCYIQNKACDGTAKR